MTLPNLLKLKYSAVIIVVTSGLLCYVSYRLGRIQDNQTLNSRHEQVLAVILTVAVPSGLGFSSWVVNHEIQELSEDRVKQAKRDHNSTVGRYQAMYSNALDEVKEKLEPLKGVGEGYQNCLLEIEKCRSIVKGFQKRDKASREIVDWLSSKKNRRMVREFMLEAIQKQQLSIPVHKLPALQQDLGRCINWLRDSILELQGYAVDQDLLTTAHLDLPNGLEVYSFALNSIKTHPVLSDLSGESMVLDDFVDELVYRLCHSSCS